MYFLKKGSGSEGENPLKRPMAGLLVTMTTHFFLYLCSERYNQIFKNVITKRPISFHFDSVVRRETSNSTIPN